LRGGRARRRQFLAAVSSYHPAPALALYFFQPHHGIDRDLANFHSGFHHDPGRADRFDALLRLSPLQQRLPFSPDGIRLGARLVSLSGRIWPNDSATEALEALGAL